MVPKMLISLLLLSASFFCLNSAEEALGIDCETLHFDSPGYTLAPSDLETPLDISELKEADGNYSYVPGQTYKCMITKTNNL